MASIASSPQVPAAKQATRVCEVEDQPAGQVGERGRDADAAVAATEGPAEQVGRLVTAA